MPRSGKTLLEIVHGTDDSMTTIEESDEASIEKPDTGHIQMKTTIIGSWQVAADQKSMPLPFPQRAPQSKKLYESNKELLETFRKVEVNMPLLDAMKQIPKYTKFLKGLFTCKRQLKGDGWISIGRNVSVLIQPLPKKCQDPETFTIPCIIGQSWFENVMLDLGAFINVMPMSIFRYLRLGPLKPISIVI